MARAVQRPAARRDFFLHYVYLAENASLAAVSQMAEDSRDELRNSGERYAVSPKSWFTNRTCPRVSPLGSHRICPLWIMGIAS